MPRLTANPPKPNPTAISSLPEIILQSELIAALGVHKTTLWRWHKAGNGPKQITISGKVFYQREDVLAWLDANKH